MDYSTEKYFKRELQILIKISVRLNFEVHMHEDPAVTLLQYYSKFPIHFGKNRREARSIIDNQGNFRRTRYPAHLVK